MDCTTATNLSVAAACTSIGVAFIGLSDSTATPGVDEMAESTDTE